MIGTYGREPRRGGASPWDEVVSRANEVETTCSDLLRRKRCGQNDVDRVTRQVADGIERLIARGLAPPL